MPAAVERLGLVQKCIAEFIGTFAIVFLGCGSVMVGERFPGTVPSAAVPLIFGLTVAAMIYAVGHISGAHFNPAVSLAFALKRHFPMKHVLSYWLAQFLGALCAMAALALLLPPGNSFGATTPHVDAVKALGWEFVLTFFLMFVIVAVATDTRAVGTMAGAAIGAAVTIGAYVGGPVTGASMNPARSLRPALFAGQTSDLWIYIVGPFAGAAFAAWVYSTIRCEPAPDSGGPEGCC